MKRIFTLTTIAFGFALGANAQFIEKANLGGDEYANSVAAGSNGTHYVAGSTTAPGGGSYDVFVTKLDADGSLIWANQYGGSNSDQGRYITATADGNFVVVGQTRTSSTDFFVTKITPDGDVIWSNAYGTDSTDQSFRVLESETGYLIAGQSKVSSRTDALLVYVGFDGTLRWSKSYGTTAGNEIIRDGFYTSDMGAFILAGNTTAGLTHPGGTADPTDGYFFAIDTTGAIVNFGDDLKFAFGAYSYDDLQAVVEGEEALYFVGYTGSFSTNGNHNNYPFIAKYSTNGVPTLSWVKTYGGDSLNLSVTSAKLLGGNGDPEEILVTGTYGAAGGTKSYLLVTDTAGAPQFAKVFGTDDGRRFNLNAIELSSNGVLFVGQSDIFNTGANDIVAVAPGEDAVFSCLSADSTFTATNQTFDAFQPTDLSAFAVADITVAVTPTGFTAQVQALAADSSVCSGVPVVLPTVTISAASATVAEGGSVVVTATLSAPSATPISVDVDLSGSTATDLDGSFSAETFEFAANATTATITLTALADELEEGDETVVFALVDGQDYDLGSPSSVTVTITDVVAGISELSTWAGVNIYPNPASAALTVGYTLLENAVVNFQITDIQGAVVAAFSEKATGGNNSKVISLETLTSGVYLLKLNNGVETALRKFVVIK